jgi:TnpA family transposase
LLNKTADLDIVIEQWEEMIRVALSLKKRTAPAHVIVQRLTNSFPSDRLSKAFTNLGRIIKTQYILRYLTDDGREFVMLYTGPSHDQFGAVSGRFESLKNGRRLI